MSRVLDPNNWDYGYDPSDPARAVGTTEETTGGIPESCLSVMPHSDQYLIFGCERSLWLLTSDPAYGGQITALSRDVGVLGPGAWRNLPDGSLVFLSRDGLYQIPAGASSPPTPISRQLLPAELLNVDWVNNTISMCYDVWGRGVHLSITPVAGTAGIHYFIDWTTGRFWPVTLPNAMQPTAMVRYAPDSTVPSQVIFGGFDGYLRNYQVTNLSGTGASWVQGTSPARGVLTPATSPGWAVNAMVGQVFLVTIGSTTTTLTCYSNTASAATMTTAGPANGTASWFMSGTDDGTAFVSLVCYGPLRIGGPGHYGEILQIAADLDSNGQGVTWGIFQGDSAQVAVAAAVTAGVAGSATWTGTWTAGANHRQFPRASGAALVIMVSGSYGWAIEGLRIEGRQKGPIR